MEINHDDINSLTEHESNYKRVNTAIIDIYVALQPSKLTKLSLAIFSFIMETKRHHQPGSKYYSEEESRRIYNNRYVSLENILERCDPVKYGVEQKDKSQDVSNLIKSIRQLEDMNIFYTWRYGTPYTYMFIMERDMGIWKYFNPKGCVTPKTLKKVIRCRNGMIETMVRMEKARGRAVMLKDIEDSYMRDLLGRLIDKMNPEVAAKIPKWDGQQVMAEYLTELRAVLDGLKEYEGVEHASDILDRLPPHLREKLAIDEDVKENKENKGEEPMNMMSLEADLVSENMNLVKSKPRKISNGERKISVSQIKPKRMTWDDVDPLSNCNHFMKFYREVIRMYNKQAKFYPYDAERIPATKIMDMLIANGKTDKDFLKDWIRYYINSYLQGNNVYKQERTSLLSFQKTFKAFTETYFRG